MGGAISNGMNDTIFFQLYSLAHQSNFLDWLIVFCAESFGYIMILLAIAYLAFHTDGVFDFRSPFLQFKNKVREMFYVFSAAATSWILASVVKSYIASPRPFMIFENVKPLFLHGGLDSFPSGHAMFFGGLATSLFFTHKRIGILYFIVALMVGLARVACGIHFPVDIFFGYVFGIIIAIIFRLIFKKIKQKA